MSKRRNNPVSESSKDAKRARKDASEGDQPSGVVSDLLDYMSASCSQFHIVEKSIALLEAAGFKRISERNVPDFDVKPNGKYYFTRNQSTLVAVAVGGQFKAGNGFSIIGAHTDSPVLKVKPVSKITKEGYLQVGVETYGGGLWNTWFDRDLSLAGRVIVALPSGKFESRLVRINRPLLRIPSLAIHLNRGLTEKGFQWNAENHLGPVLSTAIKAQLTSSPPAASSSSSPASEEQKGDKKAKFEDGHHSILLDIIAKELGVKVSDIRDFELCLYDTQPPTVMGALNEFIVARGLDNQCMSYVGLRALIDSCTAESLAKEKQGRVVVLFDNEEVGSMSAAGAGSSLIPEVLQRLNGDAKSYPAAIHKSLLVSADMAHAVHPNYPEKHEQNHRPAMHKGLVLKHNANQRYATNAISGFFLMELASKHSLPVQRFCVRQDMPCGSTIGPIIAAKAGIRTVDVGIPQLSMHSIREVCGTGDVESSVALLTHFFQEFSQLDGALNAGD